MALRRPHRKSRHGCLECKRRRVKVFLHPVPDATSDANFYSATRVGQYAQIALNAMQNVNMKAPAHSAGQMKSHGPVKHLSYQPLRDLNQILR